MNNIRKGIRYNGSLTRTVQDKADTNEDRLDVLHSGQKKLSDDMERVVDCVSARKLIFLNSLPFKTDQDIEDFMVRDPEFQDRLESLRKYMRMNAVQSSIASLVNSLSVALFSEEYRASHLWPSDR